MSRSEHFAAGAGQRPLFHGTNAELNPGDEIKSASQLHHEGVAGYAHLADAPWDVYASYDPRHAAHFGKNVYEVTTKGPVVEDPDWDDHPPNPSVYSVSPVHVVRRHS